MAKGICFGEVLWDIFPAESVIGGAPLNVAYRLNKLGTETTIMSAVGSDFLGQGIQQFLKEHRIPAAIQCNPQHETGQVLVQINESGSASYEIKMPVAWDFISLSHELETLAENTDFFVFGTLASRLEHTKQTLEKLIVKSKFPIFDINLRPPFYDFTTIHQWLGKSSLAKFNEDEVAAYCHHFGFTHDAIASQIEFVKRHSGVQNICITRGENGAIMHYENQWFEHDGFKANVMDTVGAGDSFLATLVHGLIHKQPPDLALRLACAMGALVTEYRGANPKIEQRALDEKLLMVK